MTTFTTRQSQVESLYTAYLGRAGDPPGVAYWLNQLSSGAMTLAQVSASFAAAPEVRQALPYLAGSPDASPSVFIDRIYTNLFGRVPDAAGLAYWTAQLNADGPGNVGQFVLDMISGASGADHAALSAKVSVHAALASTPDNTLVLQGPLGSPLQPAFAPLFVDNGQRRDAYVLYHIFDTDNYVVNGGPSYLMLSSQWMAFYTDSSLPLWTTHLNLSGSAPTTYFASSPTDFQNVVAIDASASSGGVTITGPTYSVPGGAFAGQSALLGSTSQLTSFKGGTGNDTLDLSGLTQLNGFTTLDGGPGRDTLMLGPGVIASPSVGFEIVTLSNLAFAPPRIDVQQLGSGIDTLNGVNLLRSLTIDNAPVGFTVSASGMVFGSTLTLNGAGTNDVLNLNAVDLVANGFETINVTPVDGGASLQARPTPGAEVTVNLASSGTTGAGLDVGTGTVNVTGTGTVTLSVVAGMLNASTLSAAPGSVGLNMVQSFPNTSSIGIIGSVAADVLLGGTANDLLQTMGRATGGQAAGDLLTGGAGSDAFMLLGDRPSGVISAAYYGGAASITDMTVGATAAATDRLYLSPNSYDYAVNIGAGGLKAVPAAQGLVTVEQVAADRGVHGILDPAQTIVKLTTGVATGGSTLQAAFDAAIGSSTVAGAAANGSYFFTLYDTTNGRMVLGIVNDTNASNTTIQAGDTVALIGTAALSAADYARLGPDQFVIAPA